MYEEQDLICLKLMHDILSMKTFCKSQLSILQSVIIFVEVSSQPNIQKQVQTNCPSMDFCVGQTPVCSYTLILYEVQ